MLNRLTYSAIASLAMFMDRSMGRHEPTDRQDSDRGDVPGWVMITVMTAIVVIALLTVFRNAVLTAVKNAFTSVNNSGNTK